MDTPETHETQSEAVPQEATAEQSEMSELSDLDIARQKAQQE